MLPCVQILFLPGRPSVLFWTVCHLVFFLVRPTTTKVATAFLYAPRSAWTMQQNAMLYDIAYWTILYNS